jgi:thiopurine S-methyltransferase
MRLVNPTITKHLETWLDGRKGCRIFFPLCGKSQDMIYMTMEGHSVVGLEGVQNAIGTQSYQHCKPPTQTRDFLWFCVVAYFN